jgi:ornithine carbamoyltransferase
MGKKESVADTARVLDCQVAAIVWRTFAHAGLEEMAANSKVPVINSFERRLSPLPDSGRPAHHSRAQGAS